MGEVSARGHLKGHFVDADTGELHITAEYAALQSQRSLAGRALLGDEKKVASRKHQEERRRRGYDADLREKKAACVKAGTAYTPLRSHVSPAFKGWRLGVLKDDDPTGAVAVERERTRKRNRLARMLVKDEMATCSAAATVYTPQPKGRAKNGLHWSGILAAFVPKEE